MGLCRLRTAQLQRVVFSNMELHCVQSAQPFKMAHDEPASSCGQGLTWVELGGQFVLGGKTKTSSQMSIWTEIL